MDWYHISDRPKLIPQLARWFQDEWGHYNSAGTFESRCQDLSARKRQDRLPLTMVATSAGELLGSYSLDLLDLPIRPELGPWLASVYVNPEHRNRGLGTQLVSRSVEHAKGLGISRLYLFTADRSRFYARMGWEILEEALYPKDERITIMSYEG